MLKEKISFLDPEIYIQNKKYYVPKYKTASHIVRHYE